MATGYRVVKTADSKGVGMFDDGVATPTGAVSDSGGFWVLDPGVRWCGLLAYFRPETTTKIVSVAFDAGDVVSTVSVKKEPQNGSGVPASPKTYTAKKVTAGTVSDLYTTSAQFSAAALTAEP
jgi:hypothetical protein